jgi:hypothetical protein
MNLEENMYRIFVMMVVAALLLAACAPSGGLPAETPVQEPSPDTPVQGPTDDPYPMPTPAAPPAFSYGSVYPGPLPGEENMERGSIFIDHTEILIMESFPPQFSLIIEGNLPTPCHQLQAHLEQPDAQNRINIEVFSLVDPDVICIQVLEPFHENIMLGSLPDGVYTIVVNGEEVGEITSP